jgi:4'-phosphopantetheinyl transferase
VKLLGDTSQEELDAAIAALPEWRREKAMRFKHEQGRKECTFAYLLLCQGLREEYGITERPVFEYGEHGKPAIVGYPHIHFNISHCREAVICAVSDRPVGVDIESVREYKDSLVNYTMNEREVAQIAQARRPELEFIRLWTMKEAVLKWSGTGINDNIKDVLTDFSRPIETIVNSERDYVYSVVY